MLLVAVADTAAAEPRRVLLLHSFGPHFAPWNAVSGRLREELIRQLPNTIDLYEASLETARFADAHHEEALVDYLRALFAGRNLDLVVAMGAPAARFIQRYRTGLFPSTPLLITGADQRAFNGDQLTQNDTAVAVTFDQAKQIENILQVLPDTTTVAVVIGDSPLERFWVQELRRGFERLTHRVTFEWFNELAVDDMLKRAVALPPHSAIYYATVRVDARGIPQEEDRVLGRLRETANAPIFSYIDSSFGHGIVGGPLLSGQEVGRQAATVAVRILGGEMAGNIKTPALGLQTPMYDWRELQRWNISEARLPPGSVVRFREPTSWEIYRWQLLALLVAVLVLTAMVTWLLIERLGRRNAEQEARNRLLEVIHLNRTAEAGALSASFAHELSQPLVAVALSAETAASLLTPNQPEAGRLKEILGDIQGANKHALDIMQHMRQLLKRRNESELRQFDVSAAIEDAMRILSPEATKRNVTLTACSIQQPLPVRADRVQLQQVILNLVTNGMDALTEIASDARKITIQTSLAGESRVEVSVSDTGPGIPNHELSRIFDTFYTTKERGTGLGLSIARTIIEACGGRIWAENCNGGGAVFRFTLPLIQGSV
jgi:signal transduction histidine kinase